MCYNADRVWRFARNSRFAQIMKKTHFIFDLDDTLTNSYEFNQQMFVDTFKIKQQVNIFMHK